jgi:Putative Flp pilus-assembly TadE/G-like/von Willebrand factor type A domain
MKFLHRAKEEKNERGQIGALIIVSLVVLLVFVGLSIDLGLAYITKTTLGKAVDAAALVAMKNVNQGTGGYTCNITSVAGLAADKEFNINYQSVPNLSTTPTPNVCFSLDANSNTLVTVSATATISTYFIRVLGPAYDTLSISASATAQRNPMVMSLVLDVSYSMESNGGSGALPTAVNNFIADFNGTTTDSDNIDTVSVITFGTYATVTVPNASPFQSKISTAMSTNYWAGGLINWTNSQAGLAAGQKEILLVPKTSNNLLRVVVFFTDGWPNIQQDTLTCPANGTTKASTANLLYCGCDPGDQSLGLCNLSGTNSLEFFDPTTCATNNSCNAPSGCGSFTGTLGTGNSAVNPQNFPDQQTGGPEELKDVTYCGGPSGLTPNSDAMYRTVQIVNNPNTNPYTATWNAGVAQIGMLHQDTYIYAIGMGTAITGQPAAQEFLREVANDPAASTFDSTLPIGEAVFASDAADLNQVFQEIAAKILLRLSK